VSPQTSLPAERIAKAVDDAGLSPLGAGIAEKFSRYYDLLEKWNSKLNLTAIRNPEEALWRHFLECIFCAQHLPASIATLLDYGSGAGFPGIPIALCRNEVHVVLAEVQAKKASFLHEAIRCLELSAEVYGGRVEDMAASRKFDAVSLRAVDKMRAAVEHAAGRVKPGGYLVALATPGRFELPPGFVAREQAIPWSRSGVLILASAS
jgi:16S rRNA (guanine527-N7)-methyltransferase